MNTFLYIDKKPLPLFNGSGFPITLTFQVEDSENIKTSYSNYKVSLEGTKETIAFFDNWEKDNVDVSTGSYPKSAIIEKNGVKIFEGIALLVSSLSGIRKEYKIELIGQNGIWFAEMQGLKLNQLALFPDHALTFGTVLTYASVNPLFGDTWGYTIVKYKDWENTDSVTHWEHTLFVTYWSIIEKAFNRLGYRVISNFFDKRFIMPIFKRKYSEEFKRRFRFAGYDTNNAQIPTPFVPMPVILTMNSASYNPLGYYNPTTGIYTVQYNAIYEILVFNDDLHNKWSVYINGVVSFPFSGAPTSVNQQVKKMFLNAGDQIQLAYTTDLGTTLGIKYALLAISSDLEIVENSAVILEAVVPDMPVSEVINGLSQGFGLCFETDLNTNTVTIEPRDRNLKGNVFIDGFYKENTVIDMTNFIDKSKPIETKNKNDLSNIYYHRWKTDASDAIQAAYDEKNKIKLGECQYRTRNQSINKGIPIGIENSVICKTMSYIADDIKNPNSVLRPVIPYVSKQQLGFSEDYDFDIRILFFAGRRGGSDGYINLYQGAGSTPYQYDFPASYFVNYNNAADFSLSYANETTLTGQKILGLFERLMLQQAKRISIGKTKIAKLFVYSSFLNSLSFRNKIRIEESEYIVNKIDGVKLDNDIATFEIVSNYVLTEDDIDNLINAQDRGLLIN